MAYPGTPDGGAEADAAPLSTLRDAVRRERFTRRAALHAAVAVQAAIDAGGAVDTMQAMRDAQAAHKLALAALDALMVPEAPGEPADDAGPVPVPTADLAAPRVAIFAHLDAVSARLDAADTALTYVLDRAQTDADFGNLLGPFTEGFRLLCEAEALRTGESVEAVKARRGKDLSKHPRRYFRRDEIRDASETPECQVPR